MRLKRILNANKKLSDILYKVSLDRPLSMQRKVQLIQNDKEMYKIKLHSIEKFNSFRGIIENFKRKRQYKNHKQGLVYLEILDEYKRKKYEPNEAEFYILEYWKKMIEAGFIFSNKERVTVWTKSLKKTIATDQPKEPKYSFIPGNLLVGSAHQCY